MAFLKMRSCSGVWANKILDKQYFGPTSQNLAWWRSRAKFLRYPYPFSFERAEQRAWEQQAP